MSDPTIAVRIERRNDSHSPMGYWCPSCEVAGRGYSTEATAQRDAAQHVCGSRKWNERYEPRAVDRVSTESPAALLTEAADRSPQDLVREFHEAFGFYVADAPSVPPERIRAERARLIVEEAAEVVSELLAGHPDGDRLLAEIVDQFEARACPAARPPDVVRLAGELADLVYVTAGAAVNWGVPLTAVLAEVHRANMAKLGPDGRPIVDEHGKARKPPGWQPADVRRAILAQSGGTR